MLPFLDGEMALLARLLYGTGMRLMEGLRPRIKDVDFDREVIVVREGKGGKDRVVMLTRSLKPAPVRSSGIPVPCGTSIYTHVLKAASGAMRSPLDAMLA